MNDKVVVPPIKCQGIKTKLVPFLKNAINFDNNHCWIEPFMGTGSDKNQYIIEFYKKIQVGEINSNIVREFLEYHGLILERHGEEYYKEMRTTFNSNGDPLYFLFLNRSDFNGMIRFNKKGEFNVPFCKKPNRFSKSYITKICNQVDKVSDIMNGKDWTFIHCDWRETMDKAKEGDFIYLDPPYIGRDTSYVGEWSENDAIELSEYAKNSLANIGLSMWKENKFRKNEHLFEYWKDFNFLEIDHFYHIGGKEKNRHPMTEVLAIKENG